MLFCLNKLNMQHDWNLYEGYWYNWDLANIGA